MLDLGWSEVMVVAALAIIIVGPRDFPRVLRTINGYVRKIRGLAGEFQGAMDEVARQADLDDIKKQVRETQSSLDTTASVGKSGLSDSNADGDAESLSDLGSNLRGISDDIKKAVFNDGAPHTSVSTPKDATPKDETPKDAKKGDTQNPATPNSLARAPADLARAQQQTEKAVETEASVSPAREIGKTHHQKSPLQKKQPPKKRLPKKLPQKKHPLKKHPLKKPPLKKPPPKKPTPYKRNLAQSELRF